LAFSMDRIYPLRAAVNGSRPITNKGPGLEKKMSPKIIVLSFVFLMTLAACEDPVATPIACGEGTELNAAGDSCTISEASLTKSFEEGVASVDITTDNVTVADEAFAEGVASVDITTDNETVADEAFAEGVASVDITTDNEAVADEAFAEGVASVDITTDNQAEYDAGMAAGVASVDITTDNQISYDEGFVAGVASVDITTDNQAQYDAGVASVDITTDNQAEYDAGFAAGVASVDITTDNQAEYDAGMAAGVASVDITTDNQAEYDAGFAAGVASVDITTDNQAEYDAGMAAGVASVTCEPTTLVWTFGPGPTNADETFTLQTNGIEGQSATMRITATVPESYTGPGDINFSAVMLNGELIDFSTATVALANVEAGLDFNGNPDGTAYLQFDGAPIDEAAGPAIAFIDVPLTLIDGVNTLSGGFDGWIDIFDWLIPPPQSRTLEISLY
jgi:hypothetical protein